MPDEVPITRGEARDPHEPGPAEAVLAKGVADRVFPGAAAAAGGSEGVRWISGVGRLVYAGGRPVEPATIYDLASLTKVVATTSVAMRLFERGRLRLDAPVREYVPEFTGDGKEAVTIEHLLTHTSGLPGWLPLYRNARAKEDVLARVLAAPLERLPGLAERYSDLGAMLLGECLARAGGKPLATLSWELVFDPLDLRDTCFCPPSSELWRIAPTEEDREERRRLIHGEVHDENASAMGGVAGHAGLFSTAEDLSRFAVEMLRAARAAGPRLFAPETVRRFTARRGIVQGSSRALGWDTRSDAEDGSGPAGARSTSGRRFSPGSFGHTGFTGTSLWIDPARDLFAVLLTNRVHPSRAGGERMLEVRRAFHDGVVAGREAVEGRERLKRAARDLSDVWFLVEQEGRATGYHRLAVRLAGDGGVIASDEMVLVSASGRISFLSETTTGPDLFDPRRSRCEVRQGSGKGLLGMKGSIEFRPGGMDLYAEILINALGIQYEKPRVHQSAEKRPPGRILFQSQVPLLLASLPPGGQAADFGELVLAEMPARLDSLVEWKFGRRLSVSALESGSRRVVVRAPDGEESVSIVNLGTDGKLERIELQGIVEKRAGRDEVRRAFPNEFRE